MSEIKIKITFDDKDTNPTAKRLEESFKKAASGASIHVNKLRDDIAGVFGGNLLSSGVSMFTDFLKSGAVALVDYSSKLESTRIGFTTLLGSAGEAQKLLSQIQELSKSTPFEFAGLASLSQKLLGAKVEASEIIPLLKDIGNIVAATGDISQERLEGVTTAITQMISKQKVSAEEMEQLAERGINGFDLLSQATGKTQADLRKMAEQGKLSSALMVNALQAISRQKFGDAMKKQSETLTGSISNIKDTLMITGSKMLEPVLKEVSKFTSEIAKELENAQDFEQAGQIVARKFAEGFGKGTIVAAREIGKQFGIELQNAIYEATSGSYGSSETGFLTKIFDEMEQGFEEGFFKPILGDDWFNKEWGNKITQPVKKTVDEINKTDSAIKDVNNSINNSKSFAKQLETEKAKADAVKLKEVIEDLTLQVQFFGDTSQVSALKQKLLSQGISDFSNVQSQAALSLAQTLDGLKANEKAADEYKKQLDNNIEKTEDLRKELTKIRQDANFELRFANPSRLEEFDRWIDENTESFRGLRGEIESTRRDLERLSKMKSVRDSFDNYAQMTTAISNLGKEARLSLSELSPLQKGLLDVAQTANLAKSVSTQLGASGGVDVTNLKFVDEIDKYLSAINSLRDAKIALYNVNPNGEVIPSEALNKANETISKFLMTLKTFDKEGNQVSLFIRDTQIAPFLDNLIYLADGIKEVDKATRSADGLKSYNQLLNELNQKLEQTTDITEFERVQKQLLTEDYKNLTEAQKENLKQKAVEIDSYKKFQEEYGRFIDMQIEAEERLSKSTQINSTEIRALVTDHLSQQKTFNESIADVIIGTYEAVADQAGRALDSLNEKTKGFLSFLIEPMKAMQRSALTELTITLMDSILPADLADKYKEGQKTVSDKISESNKYLKIIASGVNQNAHSLPSGGAVSGAPGGWLPAVLNAAFGGGIGGGGGAGGFGGSSIGYNGINPIFNVADDPFSIGGYGNGSRNASSGGVLGLLGGLFGKNGSMWGGKFGWNPGTISGIGGLASLAGGFVPGVGGNILSGIGSGIGAASSLSSILGISALGGPVGLLVGGAIGAVVGLGSWLFGNSKQRKQDEVTRTQAYQAVLKEFDAMIAQLQRKPPGISSSDAAIRRDQIISEYNSAMGQLKDSKTRKIALRESDPNNPGGFVTSKNRELQAAIDAAKGYEAVAGYAADREKRMIAEFATGGVLDKNFMLQYGDFKRQYGLLKGGIPGVDSIPVWAMQGEMFLTKAHQADIIRGAGYDVFAAHTKIPNYPVKMAEGGFLGTPKISFPSVQSTGSTGEKRQIVVNINLKNSGLVESDIENIVVDTLSGTEVQVNLKKDLDKLGSRGVRG